MRYLGSKTTTLPILQKLVLSRKREGTFCDPFGGLGTVGAHFKGLGFEVHVGDILSVAHCFQIARVVIDPSDISKGLSPSLGYVSMQDVFEHLRNLRPVRSWVHREYAVQRKFFNEENAAKIDAIRRELGSWRRDSLIDTTTHAYLLASLIDSADKVANTAGTYYAHLKQWTRRACQQFKLQPLATTEGTSPCRALLGESSALVHSQHFDILYLDPPYNGRDYAAYYHFPETLASGRRPRPTGLSGIDKSLRPRSEFYSRKAASAALTRLLAKADFNLLIMHYNDRGLIPPSAILRILSSFGNVNKMIIPVPGYSSRPGPRSDNHTIYWVEPG